METDTFTTGPSPANLILLFTLAAIAVMMLLEALLPRDSSGRTCSGAGAIIFPWLR